MILDNIISFVCEPREQDHLPSVSHSDHDGCFPFQVAILPPPPPPPPSCTTCVFMLQYLSSLPFQIIFHGEKNAFLDLDYFTNYLSKNS